VTQYTRDPEDKPLLKIVNLNDTFYLESAAIDQNNAPTSSSDDLLTVRNLNENMYLVVRSLKHNNEKIDYEVQERDILKIGRVKFAVKEIGYASDS